MRVDAKSAAGFIRMSLEARGLMVQQILVPARNAVEIITVDATPGDQRRVEKVCREQQMGRSYLVLESYSFENVRPWAQTDHVTAVHRVSPEMERRLESWDRRNLPGEGAGPERLGAIFRGEIPGFWGETAPRCCACGQPVADVREAFSRPAHGVAIHRHRGCGEFWPIRGRRGR